MPENIPEATAKAITNNLAFLFNQGNEVDNARILRGTVRLHASHTAYQNPIVLDPNAALIDCDTVTASCLSFTPAQRSYSDVEPLSRIADTEPASSPTHLYGRWLYVQDGGADGLSIQVIQLGQGDTYVAGYTDSPDSIHQGCLYQPGISIFAPPSDQEGQFVEPHLVDYTAPGVPFYYLTPTGSHQVFPGLQVSN